MNIHNKLVTGICSAAAVAVIGTGGYLLADAGSGSGSGASAAGQSTDDTITMSDEAYLDDAVAAADESGDSAAPEATASPGDQGDAGPRFARHPLRARRFLRGIHGDATVRTKDGFAQVAWQRGLVTAVSGTTLTVRSADGTVWQWVTNTGTKVRKNGDKASVSQLAVKDPVFVIGMVSGSTRSARAAVVPKTR